MDCAQDESHVSNIYQLISLHSIGNHYNWCLKAFQDVPLSIEAWAVDSEDDFWKIYLELLLTDIPHNLR